MAEISRTHTDDLAADLLEGAEGIAIFMFGTKQARKKVFNAIEKQALPVFRIGRKIHARKSTLRAWIADQENGGRPAGRRQG